MVIRVDRRRGPIDVNDHDQLQPDAVTALSSLAEPTRRALYAHVVASGDAVGRDAAAAAGGVSRSLAAFHLDRLAEDGLLDVEYRRLTGRSGPGAGRPAKLYRRAERQVELTLPPRQYALAAEVLADAVERIDPSTARPAVAAAARARGRLLAKESPVRITGRAGRQKRLEALIELLAATGFEPYTDGDEIRVRNCPFHPLAATHVEMVCGLNGDLVAAAAETLGLDVPLRLDPRPGECCVVIAH